MPEKTSPTRTIETFIPLVHFLGAFLGANCEVVLHDASSREQSVLAIANNHITGRKVGAPLTDLALKFVANREYENRDWVMGYTTRSKDDRPLHSATYFIREADGGLAGMLCLNMDVSDLKQARELLGRMVQAMGIDDAAPKDADDHSETFSESIEDLTENLIVQIIDGAEIAPERMTAGEKMEIVRTLNARGVFLLKGTVSIVATRLAASEATIYRYLQRING
ncbi:PAS domain-containing protein [Desulfovibrio mangrovi]|uniref:helix-turn-helix transcriptional regulator n=1 Tax=Desulfovibrio mangrovi TaxID=2976983 RepID=UPI0022464D93|nr:PAS domain-containing protein [Desulfovibrio mangrovi]UZP67081.1 PAS domain-containing protein [Desulfovibrio mangrovi]